MYKSNFQKNFELKTDLVARIKQILINEDTFANYKLIPISNSAFFQIAMQMKDNGEFHLLLPKLYVALTYLTGKSDSWYDPYKGSYSFTFELEIQKNHISSKYVYHVYHYRSYIEFSLYQIVPETDLRDPRVIHQPDDTLFSDNDICYFSNYFCGYSLGYLEGVKYLPKPFLKYSDSNLLLFGYAENGYFIEQYEDPDLYKIEKTQINSLSEEF